MDLFNLDDSDFDMLGDFDPIEIDPNFAPVARERANTWHGRPRDAVKEDDIQAPFGASVVDSGDARMHDQSIVDPIDLMHPSVSVVAKKATSRRNAWGNLSYADLITRAIESSPEKRLTLAEIYAWMVDNLSFFRDKGESNSSAGWKNSIRHNLSLHNRFMRVQNDGAGKSSWWIVNPDVRSAKQPRRRAATMDNAKAFHQKRGRSKQTDPVIDISPDQSTNDLDCDLPNFLTRSPEFQGRVSSNASNIGRLLPIPATFEMDMESMASGPPSSFTSWNASYTMADSQAVNNILSDSLAGILMDDLKQPRTLIGTVSVVGQNEKQLKDTHLQTNSSAAGYNSNTSVFSNPQIFSFLPLEQYPPPLHHAPYGQFKGPVSTASAFKDCGGIPVGLCYNVCDSSTVGSGSTLFVGGNMSGNGSVNQQMNLGQQLYKTPSVNDLLLVNTLAQQQDSLTTSRQTVSLGNDRSPTPQPSTQTGNMKLEQNSGLLSPQWQQQDNEWQRKKEQQAGGGGEQKQQRQRSHTFSAGQLNKNTLIELLQRKPLLRADIQKLLQLKRQQLCSDLKKQKNQDEEDVKPSGNCDFSKDEQQPKPSMLQQLLMGETIESTTSKTTVNIRSIHEKLMENEAKLNETIALSDFPTDIDLSYMNTESTADIDCNIDQVIQHELTFGDELDFNFDPILSSCGDNSGNNDNFVNFLSF